MAIRYDMTALEALKLLGYEETAGKEFISELREKGKIAPPKVYCDFMESTYNCPLFETSDIKVNDIDIEKSFYYSHVRRYIEDEREKWEKEPETKSGKLYKLSNLDEELWASKGKVKDFFIIGRDYASGSVMLGLAVDELEQEDPPVYWTFDEPFYGKWKVLYPKLSEFLESQFALALSDMDYGTGEEALEDKGWKYEEIYEYDDKSGELGVPKSVLKKLGISTGKMKKHKTISGNKVFYCYDDEKNIFFAGYTEEGELSLSAIHSADEDDLFPDD